MNAPGARITTVNRKLLKAALARSHEPETNGVPVEAVIGRGLPTAPVVTHTSGRHYRLTLGDGDGRVPAMSASLGLSQGPIAGHQLGTVHLTERCRISHDALSNDTLLKNDPAITAFITRGTAITSTATPARHHPGARTWSCPERVTQPRAPLAQSGAPELDRGRSAATSATPGRHRRPCARPLPASRRSTAARQRRPFRGGQFSGMTRREASE